MLKVGKERKREEGAKCYCQSKRRPLQSRDTPEDLSRR